MDIVTRSEWGARPPSCTLSTISNPTNYLFIHYSAGTACSTQATCTSVIQGIQNYHMDSNGIVSTIWLLLRLQALKSDAKKHWYTLTLYDRLVRYWLLVPGGWGRSRLRGSWLALRGCPHLWLQLRGPCHLYHGWLHVSTPQRRRHDGSATLDRLLPKSGVVNSCYLDLCSILDLHINLWHLLLPQAYICLSLTQYCCEHGVLVYRTTWRPRSSWMVTVIRRLRRVLAMPTTSRSRRGRTTATTRPAPVTPPGRALAAPRRLSALIRGTRCKAQVTASTYVTRPRSSLTWPLLWHY